MTIYIRNILDVDQKNLIYNELRRAGIEFTLSRTNETEILDIIRPSRSNVDPKYLLVDKIKAEVLYLTHCPESLMVNLSVYLSDRFQYDYTYMAHLFSSVEGMTLEKYVIVTRIDRVKELLKENKHTLTEIAGLMNYSSVSHLSAQFKKVVGVTASEFKGELLYLTVN